GTATAMNQASDGTNGMYANVGQGGYAADQAFIHGANANTNPSADAKDADLRPSQRNPVLADNGSARASKVIGTEVYNTDNQKLGSVDDILIGKNGVFAVLSTNQKKVTVPFDSLKLGDAKNNGDDKLVLPNETQAKLNTQLEFHYDASNYQSWQAAHNKSANAVTGNTTGVLGNNHNPKNPG
ncbi:MAG: PRC-barrel domain-containing protein, partial [Acetobacteraceae bacterium]